MIQQAGKHSRLATGIFVFVIVSGFWLLCARPGASPLRRAYYVMTILFGGAGLVLMNGTVRRALLHRAEKKKTAFRTTLYAEPLELREVDASAFHGFDVEFYDTSRDALESEGFRYLADVEYATVSATAPWASGIVRVLVGDGDTVMAGVYQLRIHGWRRWLQRLRVLDRNLKAIDLESELANGSFATTANTLGLDRSVGVPGVHRLQLPQTATLAELLTSHRRHLSEVLVTHSNCRAIRVGTLNEVHQSQGRLHVLKRQHSVGLLNQSPRPEGA